MCDESSAGVCLSKAGERRQSSEIQEASGVYSNGLKTSLQTTLPMESSEPMPGIISGSSPPPAEAEIRDNDILTPSKRSGLRHRSEVTNPVTFDPIAEAMKPLTDDERRNWTGWVELESDPALFNFILREYGVKDVKVQEVLGLESSLLALLPQPVYGLIFLYKYRDEEGEEPEGVSEYPRNVWFANQTITNACATIALLNIVMNVPDIDLGEALGTFKAESMNLKPPYRGQKLGSDAFIRNIHNSFTRRMDILNVDLALSNDMKKWKRAKKNKRKSTRMKEEEGEPGFHFIAYVPINGVVWKLDGLRRQPDNLGAYQQEDWMSVAIPNINHHIYQYQQDGVQFNLLSLCRSPLCSVPEMIAENVHAIALIKLLLSNIEPNWQQFSEINESTLVGGPVNPFGVSQELLQNSSLSEMARQRLQEAGTNVSVLINLYQEWARDQIQLQVSYMDEVALIGQENEQARRRKHDYTSIIYNSLKTLSKQGILKEIVNEVCDKGAIMQ